MKILALIQGQYGRRITENIQYRMPLDWKIETIEIPVITEPFVEMPGDYLPESLGAADLILHLCEAPQAAELLSEVAARTGARGIVASTDHGHWIPKGFQLQLQRELETRGVTAVFPKPFCTLTETHAGYGDERAAYTSEIISEFARHFGWPEFEVLIDEEGKISGLDIHRGAPCGSTYYAAERAVGLPEEEAVPTSGLRCLHYPCLASMQVIRNGDEIDTIMHTAGKVFNKSMEEALEARARSVKKEFSEV